MIGSHVGLTREAERFRELARDELRYARMYRVSARGLAAAAFQVGGDAGANMGDAAALQLVLAWRSHRQACAALRAARAVEAFRDAQAIREVAPAEVDELAARVVRLWRESLS
jgi:hypothetical protein